jgi:hypothetical protein
VTVTTAGQNGRDDPAKGVRALSAPPATPHTTPPRPTHRTARPPRTEHGARARARAPRAEAIEAPRRGRDSHLPFRSAAASPRVTGRKSESALRRAQEGNPRPVRPATRLRPVSGGACRCRAGAGSCRIVRGRMDRIVWEEEKAGTDQTGTERSHAAAHRFPSRGGAGVAGAFRQVLPRLVAGRRSLPHRQPSVSRRSGLDDSLSARQGYSQYRGLPQKQWTKRDWGRGLLRPTGHRTRSSLVHPEKGSRSLNMSGGFQRTHVAYVNRALYCTYLQYSACMGADAVFTAV